MTIIEKQMLSSVNEITKLEERLNKLTQRLAKKTAIAEKAGCADWTQEEYDRRRREVCNRHPGEYVIPFGQDDDILTKKQNEVMWDLYSINQDIADVEDSLSRARRRLDKLSVKVDGIHEAEKEQKNIEQKEQSWLRVLSRQEAEEEYQQWLAWFKESCLKDGVVINEASRSYISGNTKNGKPFCMYLNDGWTERSEHCYTLYINGHTVFTSGLFATGYRIIKN